MRLRRLVLILVLVARSSRGLAEDLDPPDPEEVRTGSKAFQYESEHFTLRFGGGLLVDYTTYIQDSASKAQMPDLGPESGIRDLRGLASGRLFWKRLTYTWGYMYDAAANKWRFRQTGLKLSVPELDGFLFVGRTKEGISTNKFTVGYYGFFNERVAVNDAFLPILADGVRWLASAAGGRLVYNVGIYADPISEDESFNKNDWQAVGRFVWLPLTRLAPGDKGVIDDAPVLHLAVGARYAGANDGFLQYRSKPEAFLAQDQAVDTGEFPATGSMILNAEAYYLNGPLSVGGEYFINRVSSDATRDPWFHGGEVFAAYLLTGEMHPYNARGAFFEDVAPARSFFRNGKGAVELAARCSYVDLDSELVRGGRFLRATALLNWYLSESLRFEAAYGVGFLDRDGLDGTTHFFQTRIQLSIE